MVQALLPFPHVDPVLLHIWGPLEIRWYALSYIAGLVLAWWGVARPPAQQAVCGPIPPSTVGPPATEDEIGDLVVWCHLWRHPGRAAGLGAALRHHPVQCHARLCRLLQWPADGVPHRSHPHHCCLGRRHVVSWRPAGTVVAVWLFCRRRKLKLLPVADLACAFVPIGLFFGRLANFINDELWGRAANVPWAMIFPHGGDVPRIPASSTKPRWKACCCLCCCRLRCACFAPISGPA